MANDRTRPQGRREGSGLCLWRKLDDCIFVDVETDEGIERLVIQLIDTKRNSAQLRFDGDRELFKIHREERAPDLGEGEV